MNIQDLEYFVAVAETLNFNRAAERLYVSQPALSYRISSLEKDMDVRLFYRDKKGVRLTAAGQILYKEAIIILEHVKLAYEKVRRVAGQSNTLTIGFLDLLLGICFKELSDFMVLHTELKVIWEKTYLVELMEGIKDGRYDVIITRDDVLEQFNVTGMETKVLHPDEFVLVVPANHRLAGLDEISDLSVLSEDTFITLDARISTPLQNRMSDICSVSHFTPVNIEVASHMDVLVAKVAAGLGVSIAPYFCGFYEDIPGLHFIKIKGAKTQSNIAAIWNKNNINRPLKAFIKYLDERF